MTTHQPKAQPDYLAELLAVSDRLHVVHSRLTAVMNSTERDGGGQLPDEWHDCYRANQAVHLAAQLVHVARDNEQARRAPVPYLPAGYGDLVEYLAGGS